MPGEVMMLEGIDDLNGFGDSAPPPLLKEFITQVARDPNVRNWLRGQGRHFAEMAIKKLKGELSNDPPNPYVSAIFGPFLDEFWVGAEGVIMANVRPLATAAALLAAGGGVVFGLLVGRRSRKAYEAGRQGMVRR